jgi:hypothetical protein
LQVNTSHKKSDNKSLILLEATKTVFTTSWTYVTMAAAITTIFWILFSFFDQLLLFFSPVLTFYLPEDAIGNFVLSSITAAILGLVINMNIHALNQRLHHFSSSIKDTMKTRRKNMGTASTSSASLFSGKRHC